MKGIFNIIAHSKLTQEQRKPWLHQIKYLFESWFHLFLDFNLAFQQNFSLELIWWRKSIDTHLIAEVICCQHITKLRDKNVSHDHLQIDKKMRPNVFLNSRGALIIALKCHSLNLLVVAHSSDSLRTKSKENLLSQRHIPVKRHNKMKLNFTP